MEDRQLLRSVGRRIAELRRDTSETQEEFADRYGASPKFIRLVEGGTENLTLTTLNRLARALRVPVSELLTPPQTLRTRMGRPPGTKASKRRRA